MTLSKGTKVEVTFDLADKCPFLKEAPVTATGIVLNDTGGKEIKVYVEAHYKDKVSYYGTINVNRKGVKPIGSKKLRDDP